MKGIVHKIGNDWFVEQYKNPLSNKIFYSERFLIHKPQEHDLKTGDVVNFELIKEGIVDYAKLKYPIPEYDPYTGEKNPFYDDLIM